jgi:hypothetical protein
MTTEILSRLYASDTYLTYLRYHPKWYIILNKNPEAFKDFEKQLKIDLKITTVDKIDQLKKQIDFINSMLKYLNSK